MPVPPQLLPRIQYEDLPAPLRRLLAARVQRLGYLGEFFQCSAHQPVALSHFVEFTETLKAALPADTVEVIALTCASVLRNEYELVQHRRLCIALGLGEQFVANVEAGCQGRESALSPNLSACQAYVLAACQPGSAIVETRFVELCAAIGGASAVAVTLTAARYVAHALVVRSFGLEPPRPADEANEL